MIIRQGCKRTSFGGSLSPFPSNRASLHHFATRLPHLRAAPGATIVLALLTRRDEALPSTLVVTEHPNRRLFCCPHQKWLFPLHDTLRVDHGYSSHLYIQRYKAYTHFLHFQRSTYILIRRRLKSSRLFSIMQVSKRLLTVPDV